MGNAVIKARKHHLPLSTQIVRLIMDMYLSGTAPVPCSEQNTTLSALMLHIFERVHEIRDAAETETEAETEGPGTNTSLVYIISYSSPLRSTYCVEFPVSYITFVIAL